MPRFWAILMITVVAPFEKVPRVVKPRLNGATSMKFGIHNPSWVFGSDPTEAFEGVKAKAQWAENHGFVWFSVMDHLIQIKGVGARRALHGRLDRLIGASRDHQSHSSRHARHVGRLPQSRASGQDRRWCRSNQPR